jgi:hypothetical protein
MAEPLKCLYLSQLRALIPGVEPAFHHLNRHKFPCLRVLREANRAECAVAQGSQERVLVHCIILFE